MTASDVFMVTSSTEEQ